MTVQNINGIHSAFYYSSIPHLLVNLVEYMKPGLQQHELICISCEQDIYDQLIAYLKRSNLDAADIMFVPVKILIDSHRSGGLNSLQLKLDEILSNTFQEGYSAIRWIGQPSFVIQQNSKRDFLNWEKDLCEALKGKNVSLLCIYDFYDHMTEQKYIDHEVIKESIKTHSHMLYEFKMTDINHLMKDSE